MRFLVKFKPNKQEQWHFYHLKKKSNYWLPHILAFLFFATNHFIIKTGIISPWIYSQKLHYSGYINPVWRKQWYLIKILFHTCISPNRIFHMIIVICSVYHGIFHMQTIFLVLPSSFIVLVSSIPPGSCAYMCN